MLCTSCRDLFVALRHVNAGSKRLSAALKPLPNPSLRPRHQWANGATRFVGSDSSVPKESDRDRSAASGRRRRATPTVAEAPANDEPKAAEPGSKRRQRSTRKREAKEKAATDGADDAAPGKKPSATRGAASGSGPRAMRTIRRKQAQGIEVTPSTPRKPSRAAKSKAKASAEDKEEAPPPENWKTQKAALEEKFKEGYEPRKRLSPDALPGIRMLHASDPVMFSTPVLAEQFKVSPEAIRRILKSKWRPSATEDEERRLRWDRRGERIWTTLAELGTRPPKKWRSMGVGRVNRKAGELPPWRRKKSEHLERVPQPEEELVEDTAPRKPRFFDRIP